MSNEQIHNDVREYYRDAAGTRAAEPGTDERWGASQYDSESLAEGPAMAANLSMGCGNPYAAVAIRMQWRICTLVRPFLISAPAGDWM